MVGRRNKQPSNIVIVPDMSDHFLKNLASPECKIDALSIDAHLYEITGKNPLDLKTLNRLATALKKNTSIKMLDLSNVLTTSDFAEGIDRNLGYKAIAYILKNNRYIEAVFLDGNPISDNGAFILSEALRESPLEQLSLTCCEFQNDSGVIRIINALQSSQQLLLLTLHGAISDKMLARSALNLLQWQEQLNGKIYFDEKVKNVIANLKAEQNVLFKRSPETLSERRLKEEAPLPSKSEFYQRKQLPPLAARPVLVLPEMTEHKSNGQSSPTISKRIKLKDAKPILSGFAAPASPVIDQKPQSARSRFSKFAAPKDELPILNGFGMARGRRP